MAADTISIADLKRLFDAGGTPDLIDVRTPAEFVARHAEGARSIPLDEFDAAAIAAAQRRSDAPVYLSCETGGRSAKAWKRLQREGVGPAFSVEGGTAAWERAGLPVYRAAGRHVISMERQVRIAAGSLVLLGLTLGRLVHPLFLILSAFVAGGLVFSGATDTCGMAVLPARMPWNGRAAAQPSR